MCLRALKGYHDRVGRVLAVGAEIVFCQVDLDTEYHLGLLEKSGEVKKIIVLCTQGASSLGVG